MNVVMDSRPDNELSDSEVQMYLFQAMRNHQGSAKSFIIKARDMFPQMTDVRLNDNIRILTKKCL